MMTQPHHNALENVAAPGSGGDWDDWATGKPTFFFGNFALRPATIAELDTAQAWTEADPDHCSTTRGDFWLVQSDLINSFYLRDTFGLVFFIRLDSKPGSEMEIHIQFSPDQSPDMRVRTMNALSQGWRWLEKRLRGMGVKTVYFRSKSQRLIYFCERRLGFTWDGRRLQREIKEAGDGGALHSEGNGKDEGEGNAG